MWENLEPNLVGVDDPKTRFDATAILLIILSGLARRLQPPAAEGTWRFRRLDIRFSGGHGYLAFPGGNFVLFMLDKHVAAFIDHLREHRSRAGNDGLIIVHLPDRWKDGHAWQHHALADGLIDLLAYTDAIAKPGDVAVLTCAERDALIGAHEKHMTSIARSAPSAPDGAPTTFEE
jgi:hypothetical protein